MVRSSSERADVIVLPADVQDSSRQLADAAGAAAILNKAGDGAGLLSAVAKTPSAMA